MAAIVFNEPVRSTSKLRPDKEYQVIVYSDGTGSCRCVDYAIRRKNMGPNFRCKHLRDVCAELERKGLISNEVDVIRSKAPAKGVSTGPQPRYQIALGKDDISRLAKRSKRDLSL